MKNHVHFSVVFTLLEILFTAVYYSLVKTLDPTILTGAALYAGSMIAGYFSYRNARYKKHKKELLDALP